LTRWLLLMLLAGSRMTFRLFRQVLPVANGGAGRRVLIYGAGDAANCCCGSWSTIATCAARRLVSWTTIDEAGQSIHGFRVFGGNGLLKKVIDQHRVEQVLISTPRLSAERTSEIQRECESAEYRSEANVDQNRGS